MISSENPGLASKCPMQVLCGPSPRSRRTRFWPWVLVAFFAGAFSLRGAEAQMNLRENLIEISGGSGAKAWTIRYGTADFYQKHFANSDGNRAWLSHGGWLRLVDIDKGFVTGRWHFPGSIVHLAPAGRGVQVQLEDKEGNRVFTRLMTFDPDGDRTIPYWPSGALMLNRVPFTEVESMWSGSTKATVLFEDWKPGGDLDLKQLIPQLEEAARRDPHAPAIRVALWRLLREVKDPRSAAVLDEALNIKSTDFTEELRIASLLESLDEPEAARRVFEAGYRDFLDKGSDPRLMTSLIGKLILYPSRFANPPDFSTERGRELMERHYRLAPYSESADLAWTAYAKMMEGYGRAEDASKWRTRSQEASYTSIFLVPRKLALFSDLTLLAIVAALVSAILCFILSWIRYRPQRRADRAAMLGRSLLVRILAAFSFQHWSLSQRVAFLSIVLVAWVGIGIETGLLRGVARVAATPLNMTIGSLAGPVPTWYIENQVPASPQRNLLLAYAHQQNGQLDQAERLYHAAPEFAESWNNLGLILRTRGKEPEAKQAFEKALQLNPKLGEAALNLGQPPRGTWVEQYARHFPGRPMLAPPAPKHVSAALIGGSFEQICLRGLAGPFADWEAFGTVFFLSSTGSPDAPAADIFASLVLAVSVLAVILLFVPRRHATEAPSRAFVYPEVLFPGIAKAWGFWGGWVLVAWTFFIVQILLIAKVGTPYILTAIAEPKLSRTYNVPPGNDISFIQLYNPSWAWVYLAPLILFIVNLALVIRARRGSGQATSSAQEH